MEGSSVPTPCPPGHVSPSAGRMSLSDCTPCPPGSFCNSSAQTEPSGLCHPGLTVFITPGYNVRELRCRTKGCTFLYCISALYSANNHTINQTSNSPYIVKTAVFSETCLIVSRQDIFAPWGPPRSLLSPSLMETSVPWDTSALWVVGHRNPVLLAASSQSLELPPSLTATLAPQGNTASVVDPRSPQVGDFTSFALVKESHTYQSLMSVKSQLCQTHST